MTTPAVVLQGVSKRFGRVLAVDSADASFAHGRIHAVVGENGAGKSTLLGLAGGMLALSSGTVLIKGRELSPATPLEAIRRGIGFVHQHFMLVEAFSALENIVLGAEPTMSLGRLDLAKAREQALTKARELGLTIELDAMVSELGVGERQTLEIVRVLVRGATTILLDEPTAVLSPAQATSLFGTLRKMADAGAAVVVVTHRLSEVMNHCDEVTVMRRGKVVSRSAVSDTSVESLTRSIMGKEPPPPLERPSKPDESKVALAVDGLSVGRRLEKVSLRVMHGQILGVAGIEGNGQQELVQSIAGLLKASSGTIKVDDQDITALDVPRRRARGLAVVHADRHLDGLLLDGSVGDNLMLGDLGTIDEPKAIDRRIGNYDVRPPDALLPARALSGGNQQKVVIARALDRLSPGENKSALRAVVLAQPTRGVDLGAARTIHEAICEAARQGAGVLIVSADLAELRAICHSILVIARGKLVAELAPETSEDVFGRAMLGVEVSSSQGGEACVHG